MILTLNLRGGQLVALVGRNGSGKTTLLRSLAGLQPFEGAIHVIRDGQDESDFPQLNMVFQNPDTQLFNPTVREEILYKIQSPNLELYEWLIQALKLENYQETQPLLLSEGEKDGWLWRSPSCIPIITASFWMSPLLVRIRRIRIFS